MMALGRDDCRSSLRVAALGAAIALSAEAFADPADNAAATAVQQQRAEKQVELRGVEDTLRASDEQRRAIESQIESVRADRARLTAALIETTAKVQGAERGVVASDKRLADLNATADGLVRSLEKRRRAIAEVLAALQRMGAHPPPAILVKPNDMAEAVRAASLLGAAIPGLRTETEALKGDIEQLGKTREAISQERDALARTGALLGLEKTRLAALLDARQAALASAEQALGAQQQRAAELAKQATSLKDLIARIDAEEAERAAAENAARASAAQAAHEIEAKAREAMRQPPQRLKPEVAFAEMKGRVPMPVAGTILRAFGAPDGLGGQEHGVSVATPPGATVAAPADGSVLFSGPYRSYGQLLIINAGGGYYMLLAGMEHINVASGEFVLAGEPVGAMGDGSVRMAAAAAVGAARPVLYIELRKDGTTIDPGPWWVKSDIEKARG